MEKTFDIQWTKNSEYNGTKLVEVTTATGETFTVWEKDSKGVAFPEFDKIQNGGKITGNLWTNPKNGKMSLYAPKAKTAYGARPNNTAAITKAQETKKENIAEAQGRKEDSMKVFAAYRDATLIVTTFLPKDKYDVNFIQQELMVWRKKFISDIDNEFNQAF